MSKYQHERPNPQKPSVVQLHKGGMWWARVMKPGGGFVTDCFFSYEEALAKANEYAVTMRTEATA